MTDGLMVASLLLVVGPIIGGIGVARPALFSAWTAPRDEHLALVRAHRRDWALANAGFATATVATAAGLGVLAGSVDAAQGPRSVLAAAAVVYAIAGTLWCAVVTLVAIGLTLAISGGVAAPVAGLATLIAAAPIVGALASREVIPAVIYFPTLLIGLALLLGWS